MEVEKAVEMCKMYQRKMDTNYTFIIDDIL